jgi:hypothetical protein
LSARCGSIGVFIEDNNSGTILVQQALRCHWPAHTIESKLTAIGKDERAISGLRLRLSRGGHYSEHAFDKTVIYKGRSRNHLVEQVEGFRVGDKDNRREDDLLDTFCYGIALALGNENGY